MPAVNEIIDNLSHVPDAIGKPEVVGIALAAASAAVYGEALLQRHNEHRGARERFSNPALLHELEVDERGVSKAASRRNQLAPWVAGTVGLGLAAAGYFGSFTYDSSYSDGSVSTVVVSDRAGSTVGSEADAITSIINRLGSYKDINGQAVSAWVGIQPADSLRSAAELPPFGNGDMHQAAMSGLDTFKVEQQQGHLAKSAMVLLTADGLGAPDDIVAEDKSLAQPVPIYVVNVDQNASVSDVAAEQQIAKATGGQYISKSSANEAASDVESAVSQAITIHEQKPWRVLEGLGLLTVAGGLAEGFARGIFRRSLADVNLRRRKPAVSEGE